jgi:hypothetical protein
MRINSEPAIGLVKRPTEYEADAYQKCSENCGEQEIPTGK